MSTISAYHIRPIDDTLRPAVQALIDERWAGPYIAVNGRLWDTRTMPGFAAMDADESMIGYLCYVMHADACEIMVLESLREGLGVGTALIEQVKAAAKHAGMKKVAVVTTNDNLHALRFYQMRGFTLRALRANMLDTSRKLKPGIPPTGIDDIPIRDEIELEHMLS